MKKEVYLGEIIFKFWDNFALWCFSPIRRGVFYALILIALAAVYLQVQIGIAELSIWLPIAFICMLRVVAVSLRKWDEFNGRHDLYEE